MYFLLALGLWSGCGWLPGKPALTSGVKEMLKFGLNLVGSSLTGFLGRNADRVVIGRALGAKVLGFYQNALFIYYNLIDLLVFSLHPVAIAGLSKMRNEPEKLRLSWAKGLSVVAFCGMPVFGILAVIGQDIVVLLLGSKWATAGSILSILALRGIPHTVELTQGWLHVAAGRTDRWMRWSILATCVQVAALLCGLPFGPIGVATAYVLCMFALFVPAISYAGKPLGIGASDLVRVVGRQLVGALVAVAVGYSLRYAFLADAPALLRTVVVTTAYSAVFLVVVSGLLKVRMPLHVLGTLAEGILPRRLWSLVGRTSSAAPDWRQK
jgi:PST family polysaccharide transporter